MIERILLAAWVASTAAVATAAPATLIDPESYRGLAADRRAYRAGDPVTIVVLETARAESRAATDADRRYRIEARGEDTSNAVQLGAGIDTESDGSGGTSRQGRITAQISARVQQVEPNGQLLLRGEQEILINGELQRIVVSGRVRAEDITPGNAVLSSRLAEAKIEFTGDGVVNDAQKHGVIYRLMRWLGVA